MKAREFPFTITGGIDVDPHLQPVADAQGHVVAFYDPRTDTEYRLIMALEAEKDGQCRYITSEAAMESHGFANLDYKQLEFEHGAED